MQMIHNPRKTVNAILGVAFIASQATLIYSVVSTNTQVNNLQADIQVARYNTEETVAVVKTLKTKVETLEQIVVYQSNVKYELSAREMNCLAKNVFHEAGVENQMGKVAVAQLTINRLDAGRWGDNVCKVVYSPSQFSWTLTKKLRNSKPKGKLWKESVEIAESVANGKRVKGLENSQFYHADYIRTPGWVNPKTRVAQIGRHIFYDTAKRA